LRPALEALERAEEEQRLLHEQARKERRARAFTIENQVLLNFIATPGTFRLQAGLPLDAQAGAVMWDVMRLGWTWVVYSMEFDPVEPGHEVPYFDGSFIIERLPDEQA
jgi:hypothetical protein